MTEQEIQALINKDNSKTAFEIMIDNDNYVLAGLMYDFLDIPTYEQLSHYNVCLSCKKYKAGICRIFDLCNICPASGFDYDNKGNEIVVDCDRWEKR